MIPDDKKAAVQRALQTAFGVIEFEDISLLTEGLSSALIFKIVVAGKPYLLRIITRTDAISDPTNWFGCMQMAADAGIAPHVWYTSIEDRICITDFIEKKPFPVNKAREKVPALLKRLHALPPFLNRVNYIDAINNFIGKLLERKTLPEEILTDLSEIYSKITNIYPRNSSDQVSCHNDLKPENMLFDGDSLWLVDWEAAFLNDRYFDLAIVANFVVMNEDDEKEYLKGYFGENVNEYHLARFFLMRQLLHISYFAAFMLFGGAPGSQVELTLPKPDFREFNDGVWAGEISLANFGERQQYAWAHLARLKENLQQRRFHDSLAIVSNYRLH